MAAPSILLVSLASLAPAQDTTSDLAAFLKIHPPAASWIAVDPGHVQAKGSAIDLAGFERKAVPVGRLTAVVPVTMVTIDDRLTQSPNLYDGLPRDAKILALMASLTPGQWRLLGGRGLGMNDVQGEPRTILASLLPQPFNWKRNHLHDGVMHMKETERLTLPAKDVAGVRLRLYREISLMVHPGGRSGHFGLSFGPTGKGDTTLGELDDKAEAGSSFGLAIRQVAPNRPKPGGIRFGDKAYDAPISLSSATTVREALALVSRATRQEILPDLRVADLSVDASGGRVRAGDLLGALALGVTGTYRPVGPGFVLTSDLTGLGTRKRRIERWQGQAGLNVQARTSEWSRSIDKSGGLRAIGYPENAPLRADDELQRRLDAQPLGMPPDVPTSSLPPEFGEALEKRRAEYAKFPDVAFTTDRVGVLSELKFAFVLPDGTEVASGSLPPWQALDRPAPSQLELPDPPAAPPAPMSQGDHAASLAVTAESVAQATEAIRLASAYGFRELWLETHDSSALREAIAKAGRPVHLVIRPWTAPPDAKPTDPDRTLLGDHAREVVATALTSPFSTHLVPPDAPTPLGRDLLSPARTSPTFSALAQTPGLAGVVVLDSQPEGYADGGRADGDGDFGYSQALRWAFLQANGIDPLDIVPPGISRVELSQPFFPDNGLMSLATINEEGERRQPEAQAKAYARWRTFRAEANGRATESLLASFGNVPVLVQLRQTGARSHYRNPPLLSWHPGEPLPTQAKYDANDPFLTVTMLHAIADDQEAWLRQRLGHPETGRTDRIVLDLSDVPPTKWTAVLDRILKRRP